MNNTCKKCNCELGKHWYRMSLEPMSFETDYRYTIVTDICNKCAAEILGIDKVQDIDLDY